MASAEEKGDRIISIVAHHPQEIIDGMIRISKPVKPPGVRRRSASSSPLGNLERLPLEVAHITLARLDFKSLMNFSLTSLRGLEIVKSLPQYRHLMHHAPHALTALAKTTLLSYYSVDTIFTALRSADCVSCGRYGAFLFLPTCQRSCYNCLRSDESLMVIPIEMAKTFLPISEADFKTLPVMRGISGEHFVGRPTLDLQHIKSFVSVGAAKRLAISKGESEEDTERCVDTMRFGELATSRFLRLYQEPALEPPGPEFFESSCGEFHRDEFFHEMASSIFPHLNTHGQVEDVYWCFGCEVAAREWLPIKPFPEHLAHLLFPDRRKDETVDNTKRVARLRSEFLDHVKQCPGAKSLLFDAYKYQGRSLLALHELFA